MGITAEANLKPIYFYDPVTDMDRVIRWEWEGDPNSVLILDERMFIHVKDKLPWKLIVVDDSDPFAIVLAREDSGLFLPYYQYQYWFLRRVSEFKLFGGRIILTMAVWGLATVNRGVYLDWGRVHRSTKIWLCALVLAAIGIWMCGNAANN